MNSIRKKYREELVPKIKEQFSLSNNLEVPRLEKVVLNVGIGRFIKDSSQVEDILSSLTSISGQKAVLTRSKKSIAGFKIREGLEVGAKVTLRGEKMWSFIEKLILSALPRVKDFHGLKFSAVDAGGNLNIGVKEQLIFPEILPEQVKNIFSLQITVVSNAKGRERGEALFRHLGFPIIASNKSK